eukprot:scaffold383_cov351-Pavlova_lutheri.AAC.5
MQAQETRARDELQWHSRADCFAVRVGDKAHPVDHPLGPWLDLGTKRKKAHFRSGPQLQAGYDLHMCMNMQSRVRR